MELRATAGGPGRGHGHAVQLEDPASRSTDWPDPVFVGPAARVAETLGRGDRPVAAILSSLGDEPRALSLPVPWVGFADADVILSGDAVTVDGGTGRIVLDGVDPVRVVTVFLQRGDGLVLLLRRSAAVGTFQGRWAGVSGFLEDPTPLEQARREVREEAGIDLDATPPEVVGELVYARDGRKVFEVHPFRFRVASPSVRIDWEHTEYEWVPPGEIARRPTVPKLEHVWRALERAASARAPEAKGV